MEWKLAEVAENHVVYQCDDGIHEGRYRLKHNTFPRKECWEMTDTTYDATFEVGGKESAFEDFLKAVRYRITDLQYVKSAAESMMEKEASNEL